MIINADLKYIFIFNCSAKNPDIFELLYCMLIINPIFKNLFESI